MVLKIGVIGDIIVDRYYVVEQKGKPQESDALFLVQLDHYKPEINLGGAANVANNLSEWGFEVDLIGHLPDSYFINEINPKINFLHVPLIFTKTCIKNRFVDITGKHIVRIDDEVKQNKPNYLSQKKFEEYLHEYLPKWDRIIFSDYEKGIFCNFIVWKKLFQNCFQDYSGFIIVDPKFKNWNIFTKQIYPRFIIKCNKTEFEYAKKNYNLNDFSCIIVTNGQHPVNIYENGKWSGEISVDKVVQVNPVGAGDIFTAGLAVTIDTFNTNIKTSIKKSIVLASYSVTQFGTTCISKKVFDRFNSLYN